MSHLKGWKNKYTDTEGNTSPSLSAHQMLSIIFTLSNRDMLQKRSSKVPGVFTVVPDAAKEQYPGLLQAPAKWVLFIIPF